MSRVDEVEIGRLHELARDCDWFQFDRVYGRGLVQTIMVQLQLLVFAWRLGQDEPVLRNRAWSVSLNLARGMAVQPLVLIAADDEGYLPAGGNISDWTPHRGPRGDEHMLPGAVCYADRWHPRLTLAWLAHQVAQILVGAVFNFEAHPLSRRGRDFQAKALAEGTLPTEVISAPQRKLLYLDASGDEVNSDSCGIEFDDVSI
jgi:hypothetical protein